MSKNADIAYLLAQANSGSASAQYNLGVIYLSGEQVEQNYEKALAYFTLAANHGNTKAEYNLGVMYANGYGVKQNYDRAWQYYNMAANKGYANAIGALGYMYQFGLGVKQSYDDALSHYQHAISLGDNYCKKYVKMILNTQHYKEQPIKINEVANNQEPKEDPETSIAAFEVPEEFR